MGAMFHVRDEAVLPRTVLGKQTQARLGWITGDAHGKRVDLSNMKKPIKIKVYSCLGKYTVGPIKI